MISIFLEDSFDAAHWLPNVREDHKCRRPHGHTYRIRLEVTGQVDTTSGWIMDYAELREKWLPLKEKLDHRSLNDFLPNPTCEVIAAWIVANLCVPGLKRLELRETVNCGVVYTL
jgi:6-pyruvoyltetrahydropterin/6-carboxytetrahydropterin synthase